MYLGFCFSICEKEKGLLKMSVVETCMKKEVRGPKPKLNLPQCKLLYRYTECPHFTVIDGHTIQGQSQQGKAAILDVQIQTSVFLYLLFGSRLSVCVIIVYKTFKWNTVTFLVLFHLKCTNNALFSPFGFLFFCVLLLWLR